MQEILLEGLENHKESLITPLMTESEFHSLKIDIMNNGQLDPITTYRGKVVDGRNRCNVLRELQKTTVKAVAMKTNSTIEDVKSLVQSKETRRKQTPTQLAIYAFKLIEQKVSGMTQVQVAHQIGTTDKAIGQARFLNKHLPHLLDILFEGKKVKIPGIQNTFITTNSLTTLVNTHKAKMVEDKESMPEIVSSKLSDSDRERVAYFLSKISLESQVVQTSINAKLYTKLQGN